MPGKYPILAFSTGEKPLGGFISMDSFGCPSKLLVLLRNR